MLFFNNKDKPALERLQQHDYKDMKEKLELLEQLSQEQPSTKDLVIFLSDADNKLREFAIERVIKDKSPTMLELLVNEIKTKELGRKYIPPVLAKCNPIGLLQYLQRTISSPNLQERLLVTEIISYFSSTEKFISILEEALQDPDEKIRYFAVQKLCFRIRNKDIFLQLLPLLNDESERIRHKIIQEMVPLNNPEIIEPFFARLPEEPREIQDKMITSLSNLAKNPDLDIAKYVIPILASDNEMVRDVAARLLAQLPNKKEIMREFLLYLRGIASWLRERIFESIAKIATSIIDAIIALLEDPIVKIDCMFLAPYTSDQRVVPGIIKIFQSDVDWWIKVSALDILIKLKASNLSEMLQKYQNNSDLKWAVIGAYGDIGDISGIDFLIQCLQEKSRYIRLESLRSLAKFKIPKVDSILKDLAENSKDRELREEANRLAIERNISVVTSPEVQVDKESIWKELKSLGIEMEDEILNDTDEKEKENLQSNSPAEEIKIVPSELRTTVEEAKNAPSKIQPSSDTFQKKWAETRPVIAPSAIQKPIETRAVKFTPLQPPTKKEFTPLQSPPSPPFQPIQPKLASSVPVNQSSNKIQVNFNNKVESKEEDTPKMQAEALRLSELQQEMLKNLREKFKGMGQDKAKE